MINNRTLAVLFAVLVVILGIQSYGMFRMNSRLNQLSGQKLQADSPPLKISPPTLPTQGRDDALFKDNPWNPYQEMQRMQKEMEQLFGDSFSRFHLNTPPGNLSKIPDIDLQEKSDRYIVTVNAPGADESSLVVKLEGRVLHVSMKTEHAEDKSGEENGQYSFRERFMGEFDRALTLPGPADAAKMTTDYYNGVLVIILPKA